MDKNHSDIFVNRKSSYREKMSVKYPELRWKFLGVYFYPISIVIWKEYKKQQKLLKSKKKGENGEKEKKKEKKKDSRPTEDQGGSKNQGSLTNATTAGGDGTGAGGDDGGDEEKERKRYLPADKIVEGPVREESEEKEALQREEGDHAGKIINTINMQSLLYVRVHIQ